MQVVAQHDNFSMLFTLIGITQKQKHVPYFLPDPNAQQSVTFFDEVLIFTFSFNQRSSSQQQRCSSTVALLTTQKLNPKTEDMKINIIISTMHLLPGIGWIRSAQVDTISSAGRTLPSNW